VHPLQNKKANDFNDLCAISKHFVKEKKDVFILPKLTASKGDLYKYIYAGAYKNRQPDLLIGGVFYEYESFIGKMNARKINTMINRALIQSDCIIIDIRNSNMTARFATQRIYNKIMAGEKIKIAYLLTDNGLIKVI